MSTKVSIVGMGKLGSSMAAAFADKGFNVIGVDINPESVDNINRGIPPVEETGLVDLFVKNSTRLRATLNLEEAILGSDISFVVVPTPSLPDGGFSLEYVRTAFSAIAKALSQKSEYHLVVLTSTVLPGSTSQILLPLLASESGKEPGSDFGLCYSPEFIALGSIVRDFLNPDFTLIGELDDRSGRALEELYQGVVENGAPSARMSLENAELAKLAVNTFVTTKIAFANMLASICERLPGGDVDVVSHALGMDTRIGRKYLTGALGYGGPCFPRDNAALSQLAQSLGINASLSEATDAMNRSRVSLLVRDIESQLTPESTVAVLGLAYKPDSYVTEESQGLEMAEYFSNRGFEVLAYDPLSKSMIHQFSDWNFTVMESVWECIDRADIVIVSTPDPCFATLNEEDFCGGSGTKVVYDAWRILRKLEGSENVEYFAIGLGRSLEEDASEFRSIGGRLESIGASV